jgi:integral membrane protein (TIGR01906 family)
MSSSPFRFAISWVVTLLVPVVLVLSAMRAMMTPAFLYFEYNTPNFPPDSFGFTKEDRLYWSQITLDYLLNPSGISFLADLRFKNGAPVYNERELQHMVDVKNTIQATLLVWYASLAVLIALGVFAWGSGIWDDFKAGLRRGGWLTVILLVGIIAFVLFGFNTFFVAFHNVFFQPGTWMFLYSDTLIRLFPERFWQDIFIYVGSLSLVGGLLIAFLTRRR